MLHRCVEKSFDLGERDDLIELLFDLGSVHAEDRAIQKNIFATRELRVKSRADFEKTSDSSADRSSSARRFCNSREDLEQRRFPCAVVSDQTQRFAFADREADIAQCPEQTSRVVAAIE